MDGQDDGGYGPLSFLINYPHVYVQTSCYPSYNSLLFFLSLLTKCGTFACFSFDSYGLYVRLLWIIGLCHVQFLMEFFNHLFANYTTYIYMSYRLIIVQKMNILF